MSQKRQISLREMKAGQAGVVVQILGGRGLINRLQALGIRPGKRITKLSSMFMRGPVTVRVDNMEVALGFGMTDRIMVELEVGDNQ